MQTTISKRTIRRNNRGNRQRVVLTRKEYERLSREVEDLEDALAYETAKRTARGFTLLEDFIRDLRKAGKLKS
jgi:PHD/YefM family antitoxin component YafN of YafNO toxin-antitoxin module